MNIILEKEYIYADGRDYVYLIITKDDYEVCIGAQSINDKYNEVINNNTEQTEEVKYWIEIDNCMYAYLPDEVLDECCTAEDVIERMKLYGIDIPEEIL